MDPAGDGVSDAPGVAEMVVAPEVVGVLLEQGERMDSAADGVEVGALVITA